MPQRSCYGKIEKMKRLIKLFGLLLLLVGCSKSDGIEEPQMPENPTEVEPLPTNVELTDSTVQLNNAQLAFLSAVDEENTMLTFSASLPAEYLPQEGQILLQMTPTKTLPYGFVGRVTKIEQSAKGYVVHTDTPTLTEIFNKLQVEGELQAATESRAIPTDDEGFYVIEHPIELEVKGGKLSGNVKNGFHPYRRIDIDKETGQNDILFRFDIKNEVTLSFILSPNIEFDKVSDLGQGKRLGFTSAFGVPILIYLQPYLTTGGEVNMGANLSITAKEYNKYTIEKNGLLPQITYTKGDYDMGPTLDISSMISGEFFAGVGLRADFRFFGRKDLSAGIGPELGVEAAGEVGLKIVEENQGAESTYDALKDNSVSISGKTHVSGYINSTLFDKKQAPWHESLASFTFAERSFYMFPEFDDCAIEEANGTINATTTVKRDLFLPASVGIASYQDGEVKKYGKAYPYRLAKDFQENPLSESFKDEKDTEYWTYIKFGGIYVKGVKLEGSKLRAMLIKFYHDTGGDNWTCNDNWCSDKPIDEWYGVDCVQLDSLNNTIIRLWLSSNNLTGNADLSGCTALGRMECSCNQLTSLNLSGCTNLSYGDGWGDSVAIGAIVNSNPLTELNLSHCTSLERLEITGDLNETALKALNISNCTNIESVHCQACSNLISLNTSGCTALKFLSCNYNNLLASLDVSGCTALETLICSDNPFYDLNVNGLQNLKYLCCSNTCVTLSVLDCVALETLHCNCIEPFIGPLKSLEISGCPALEVLWCENNQLTSLNVSGCTALEHLSCENNPITQQITKFYQSLAFRYDERYSYDRKYINGEWVTIWSYNYDDHHGWYYPNEPYGIYGGN